RVGALDADGSPAIDVPVLRLSAGAGAQRGTQKNDQPSYVEHHPPKLRARARSTRDALNASEHVSDVREDRPWLRRGDKPARAQLRVFAVEQIPPPCLEVGLREPHAP